MKQLLSMMLLLGACASLAVAQNRTEKTDYEFSFVNSKDKGGVTAVHPADTFSEEKGWGYDFGTSWDQKKGTAPFYFSVNVPDGNYKVTVTLGSKRRAGATVVRAENRRLFLQNTVTGKGKSETFTFVVNKRSPEYVLDGKPGKVALKPREKEYKNWDRKLTFEFNGEAPCVQSLKIERDTTALTVFLCGNSTVVDQASDPYASWGQLVTCWLGDGIAISNHGESGLTARTFIGGHRLDKVLSMLKPGDYVVCEFGHNDEKEHRPGDGAWYHYTYQLKIFVDMVRKAGGNIIFCTPTARRNFEDNGKIRNTHGEFPAAMKAVAERENVPLIDLTAEVTKMYEAFGEENSKKTLVHYPKAMFNSEKDLADNTHFNPFGAWEISKMMVMGWKNLGLPMVQYLRPGWTDFDAAAPDAPEALVWPWSGDVNTTKPDGN